MPILLSKATKIDNSTIIRHILGEILYIASSARKSCLLTAIPRRLWGGLFKCPPSVKLRTGAIIAGTLKCFHFESIKTPY
jgi:hypothetical protein